MALERVRTTTGLFLSGGAKLYRRTSPRTILPAMPPPLPKDRIHRTPAAAASNPRGRVLPRRALPISGDVPAELRARARNDSVLFDARHCQWRAATSYREQSGRFPYIDPIPQYTPHTGFGPHETHCAGAHYAWITGKPETTPQPSLRYLPILFSSTQARAARRIGARFTAAVSHAVFQKPKTGIR